MAFQMSFPSTIIYRLKTRGSDIAGKRISALPCRDVQVGRRQAHELCAFSGTLCVRARTWGRLSTRLPKIGACTNNIESITHLGRDRFLGSHTFLSKRLSPVVNAEPTEIARLRRFERLRASRFEGTPPRMRLRFRCAEVGWHSCWASCGLFAVLCDSLGRFSASSSAGPPPAAKAGRSLGGLQLHR